MWLGKKMTLVCPVQVSDSCIQLFVFSNFKNAPSLTHENVTDSNAISLYQPGYLWKQPFSFEAIAFLIDCHFSRLGCLRLGDVWNSLLKFYYVIL